MMQIERCQRSYRDDRETATFMACVKMKNFGIERSLFTFCPPSTVHYPRSPCPLKSFGSGCLIVYTCSSRFDMVVFDLCSRVRVGVPVSNVFTGRLCSGRFFRYRRSGTFVGNIVDACRLRGGRRIERFVRRPLSIDQGTIAIRTRVENRTGAVLRANWPIRTTFIYRTAIIVRVTAHSTPRGEKQAVRPMPQESKGHSRMYSRPNLTSW